MENQENNRRVSGSLSSLFRKALAVKDVNIVVNKTPTKTTNGLTLRELEQRARILRQKKRVPPPGIPISEIKGIQKRDDGHDNGNTRVNILQNLDKLKEQIKQNNVNNRANKLPLSAIRPDDWNLNDSSNTGELTSQLQRILDAKRFETSNPVLRKNNIDQSQVHLIGNVLRIQILSDSLKVVEIEQDNDKDVVLKMGIVTLWNEWVDIKKGDSILFEDVKSSSNLNNDEIQWSSKWKKLVGS